MSAVSWFFFWIRTRARSSWLVETAASSSASVCARLLGRRCKRSSTSSRRRMMAGGGRLQRVYFSTIELMAFS
jgi:hypothetical protein